MSKIAASDQFEIHVSIKLCYKISDDGKSCDWSDPDVTITDKNGEASGFDHLGLGEDGLMTQIFSIGGKVKAGMSKDYSYQKTDAGFANAPDKFTSKKTPPPGGSGQGELSDAAKQKAQQAIKSKMPISTPKSVNV